MSAEEKEDYTKPRYLFSQRDTWMMICVASGAMVGLIVAAVIIGVVTDLLWAGTGALRVLVAMAVTGALAFSLPRICRDRIIRWFDGRKVIEAFTSDCPRRTGGDGGQLP